MNRSSPVGPVEPLEDDRGVAVVPVVVLEDDADPLVGREVGAAERVRRVGRLRQRQEPSGCSMTQRESMPMWLGTMSLASRMPRAHARSRRLPIRRLAAQVVGDAVVVERVGGRHRVRVAAHPLDPLRRERPLPEADQPEAGDAPARRARRAPRRGSRRASGCRAHSGARAGRARRTCSWRSARAAASRRSRPRRPPARRRGHGTMADGPVGRRRRRRRRTAGGARGPPRR